MSRVTCYARRRGENRCLLPHGVYNNGDRDPVQSTFEILFRNVVQGDDSNGICRREEEDMGDPSRFYVDRPNERGLFTTVGSREFVEDERKHRVYLSVKQPTVR